MSPQPSFWPWRGMPFLDGSAGGPSLRFRLAKTHTTLRLSRRLTYTKAMHMLFHHLNFYIFFSAQFKGGLLSTPLLSCPLAFCFIQWTVEKTKGGNQDKIGNVLVTTVWLYPKQIQNGPNSLENSKSTSTIITLEEMTNREKQNFALCFLFACCNFKLQL